MHLHSLNSKGFVLTAGYELTYCVGDHKNGDSFWSEKNLRFKEKCSVTLCVLNHSYQQTFLVTSDVDSRVDHFTCRKKKERTLDEHHIEVVIRIIFNVL